MASYCAGLYAATSSGSTICRGQKPVTSTPAIHHVNSLKSKPSVFVSLTGSRTQPLANCNVQRRSTVAHAEPDDAADAATVDDFDYEEAVKNSTYTLKDVEAAIQYYEGQGPQPSADLEFITNRTGVSDAWFFHEEDDSEAYATDEFILTGIPEAAPKKRPRDPQGFNGAERTHAQNEFEMEGADKAGRMDKGSKQQGQQEEPDDVMPEEDDKIWDWLLDSKNDGPPSNLLWPPPQPASTPDDLNTARLEASASAGSGARGSDRGALAAEQQLRGQQQQVQQQLLEQRQRRRQQRPHYERGADGPQQQQQAQQQQQMDAEGASAADPARLELLRDLNSRIEAALASAARASDTLGQVTSQLSFDDPDAGPVAAEEEEEEEASGAGDEELPRGGQLFDPVAYAAFVAELAMLNHELDNLVTMKEKLSQSEGPPTEEELWELQQLAAGTYVAAGDDEEDEGLLEEHEEEEEEEEVVFISPEDIEDRDVTEEDLEGEGWTERIAELRRVTKVVKGGRRMSFRCVAIVGNQAGVVGCGCSSGREVAIAVKRALVAARSNLIRVPIVGSARTLPHRAEAKFGAAKCVVMPASEGTGVIAGGSIRTVLEMAGVQNCLAKRFGSRSPLNNARAAMRALQSMHTLDEVAHRRGVPLAHLLLPRKRAKEAALPPPEAKPAAAATRAAAAGRGATKRVGQQQQQWRNEM